MKQARGTSRSTGTDYLEVVSADTITPPEVLTETGYDWIDEDRVSIDRYVSQEFHDLEAERLWPKVWQMACRLEHIENVGDYVVYDICDLSIIVVRVSDSEVKAYHNSCLHRGRSLVDDTGNAAFFKCPFHGFAWSLDGTFRGMPAPWDFPHVEKDSLSLPEAQVAIWRGFVMINPDPQAESFETYAHPLDDHFDPWPLEDRYVAYHTCQVVDANWKTTQEAFLEAYHVSTTHGHTLRFANDFDCKYDVFGRNVSRLVQALALPATQLIGQVTEAEMAATLQKMLPKQDRQEVPDDVLARPWVAERFRKSLGRQWRTDFTDVSEAEMLDSIQYFLFPNFAPWGGYALPIVYRFRPWENDPQRSLMEMQLLHPIPDDGQYTTAEPFWLEPGQSWSVAPGFEALGMVIDQDMDNLPFVQKGLRSAQHEHLVLSDYQEIRIRHFHRRLDEIVGLV